MNKHSYEYNHLNKFIIAFKNLGLYNRCLFVSPWAEVKDSGDIFLKHCWKERGERGGTVDVQQ